MLIKSSMHTSKYLLIIFSALLFTSCNNETKMSSVSTENWSKRKVSKTLSDSLEYGKSYLSTYSQIFSMSEHKTHNLTTMVSLRNTSDVDTIYVLSAKYFDTHGKHVRPYIGHAIFLAPMETCEIIIDEIDNSGGTGSNFVFEWKTPKDCPEPLFEAIMNSTVGQQGLSFATQARRIK
ncbi:DUF3124 domain-containing protein [Algibacter lectus]|uniref:DUF3124 domain-containing protein n=1 Tax=Algibacter lectus TaxID=221126 RepID=UPI001D110978|nr:DUF3124 domain-containing protein [Algibacter lectus]